MPLHAGVNGVNREIKNLYAGVNGTNRQIDILYAGVNGVNYPVFKRVSPKVLFRYVPQDVPLASSGAIRYSDGNMFVSNYTSTGLPGTQVHTRALIFQGDGTDTTTNGSWTGYIGQLADLKAYSRLDVSFWNNAQNARAVTCYVILRRDMENGPLFRASNSKLYQQNYVVATYNYNYLSFDLRNPVFENGDIGDNPYIQILVTNDQGTYGALGDIATIS